MKWRAKVQKDGKIEWIDMEFLKKNERRKIPIDWMWGEKWRDRKGEVERFKWIGEMG